MEWNNLMQVIMLVYGVGLLLFSTIANNEDRITSVLAGHIWIVGSILYNKIDSIIEVVLRQENDLENIEDMTDFYLEQKKQRTKRVHYYNSDLLEIKNMTYADAIKYKIYLGTKLIAELLNVPYMKRDEHRIRDVYKAIKFNKELLKELYE